MHNVRALRPGGSAIPSEPPSNVWRRIGTIAQPSAKPSAFSSFSNIVDPLLSSDVQNRKKAALDMMRAADSCPKEGLQDAIPKIARALVTESRRDEPNDSTIHYLLAALEHAVRKGCDISESLSAVAIFMDRKNSLFTRQAAVMLIDNAVDICRKKNTGLNLVPILEKFVKMIDDPDEEVRRTVAFALSKYSTINFAYACQVKLALRGLDPAGKPFLSEISRTCDRIINENRPSPPPPLSAREPSLAPPPASVIPDEKSQVADLDALVGTLTESRNFIEREAAAQSLIDTIMTYEQAEHVRYLLPFRCYSRAIEKLVAEVRSHCIDIIRKRVSYQG